MDLLIIDVSLPDGNGLELVKDVEARDLPVKALVLSRHDEMLYGLRALQAGAQGFVQKGGEPDHILQATRKVLAGELVAPASLQYQILRQYAVASDKNAHPLSELSDRELQVLEMIGRGLFADQIAEHLHLSPKTVHTYRQRIKEKIALKSSAQLMREATRFVEGSG